MSKKRAHKVPKPKKNSKKSWRKINTDELNESLAEQTRKERQRENFERVPDADLFFLDDGAAPAGAAGEDAQGGATPASTEATPRTKRDVARQKTLRTSAILEAAHKALPVAEKQGVRKARRAQPRAAASAALAGAAAAVARPAPRAGIGARAASRANAAEAACATATRPVDLWVGTLAAPSEHERVLESAGVPTARPKRSKAPKASGPQANVRPAVHVDAPGCSYNPDPEQHQEAIAVAVAAEVRKQIDRELRPTAPPKEVLGSGVVDELEELLVEEEEEEEEEGEEGGSEGEGDRGTGEEEGTSGAGDGDGAGASALAAARASRPKTKADRNRLRRHKEALAVAGRARVAKRLRRDLTELRSVVTEVDDEARRLEEARIRREAEAEDRAAEPPRKVGGAVFIPMPAQVLTTDEVGLGLRLLKATPALAVERYKSLQARGLVVPEKKHLKQKKAKRIVYEGGNRGEHARLLHEAEAARKHAAKAAARK